MRQRGGGARKRCLKTAIFLLSEVELGNLALLGTRTVQNAVGDRGKLFRSPLLHLVANVGR